MKEDFLKRIKIAGMISFIPVILAAGPLSGFFVGSLLREKFNLSFYFLFICIGLGVIISVKEVVRIIRLVLNIDKKA